MSALGKGDYELLRSWILQLPDVTEAPHRFGGTEFRVQTLEFMHSHGTSHLDIRLSKEDQARVLNDGKASEHRFAPKAGWVTLRLQTTRDAENAKHVIKLAYDHAHHIMEERATRDSKK